MDPESQIRVLHQEGLRPVEIAHRLGLALSSVHRQLRSLEESRPRTGGTRAKTSSPVAQRQTSGVRTRALVADLLAAGLARNEIARRLGLSKSVVSYHARRLGAEINIATGRRFDWRPVQAHYDAGHSVRECMVLFGFSTNAWHLAIRRGDITPRPAFRPLDEIFASGVARNRGHLKRRLLSAGIKESRCELCGLSEWHGEPLSLALHHVNGDRLDNRLENLQLLCPNCHSQTHNFAGRNWPSRRRTTVAAPGNPTA